MLRLLSLLLLIALLGQLAGSYGELPATMATHFDGLGAADGWMSKPVFSAFMAGIGLLIFVVMGGVPSLWQRLPGSLLNIPHKEYWLAPEREQETRAFLDRHMGFMRVITLSFLIAVSRDVIQANMVSPPQLPAHIWWQTVTYMVAVFAWSIFLLWHFYRTPDA